MGKETGKKDGEENCVAGVFRNANQFRETVPNTRIHGNSRSGDSLADSKQ